jgi:hypothetical protein
MQRTRLDYIAVIYGRKELLLEKQRKPEGVLHSNKCKIYK